MVYNWNIIFKGVWYMNIKNEDHYCYVALDLVRVTEAAALKASRWMGKGDKNNVDKAAVDAMRGMLDYVEVSGTIIIGEGEKDEAPMLYIGEKVGRWDKDDCEMDIAVDPVDGTRLTAKGLPNAMSVIAAGEKGSLAPIPSFYMRKLACGPDLKGKLNIDWSVKKNLEITAKVLDKNIENLTVAVLERERHNELVNEIRQAGARIQFIIDGDIAGAIATCLDEHEVDLYLGIGGAPEAVLAAAALKCLDGEIQAKFWWQKEEERKNIIDKGFDIDKLFFTDDLAKGDSIIFCATGVTNGEMLKGVTFGSHKATTHTMMMRAKTKTVRYITAIHNLNHKTIHTKELDREELV